MHGVFAASNPTTNGIEGGFGKEPDYWEVVASPPLAGGLPPTNVTNYPIVKGVIDSPSTAPAGTTTYGVHIGAIFPASAADSAGNVYAVWSTCSARPNASIPPGTNNATTYDIWFAASHDHGQTFYGPFKLSGGIGTSVFPWIDAGDNGRVDVVWYQSANPSPPLVSDPSTPAQLTGGPNQMPAGSTWTVVFAQSLNANSREPAFTLTTASDHIIHTGSISIGGTFGSADRSLLDYFKVAIGPDGLANIMCADNGTSSLHINYMRQNGGASAVVNPTYPTCLGDVTPLGGVVSRMTHGTAGVFDIDMPLTGTRGIECRGTGTTNNYALVFKFRNPLTSVGGVTVSAHNPTSGTGTVSSSMIDPTDAHNYIVNLTNVSTGQYLTVTLTTVADSTGNNQATVVGPQVGILVGDVNASARVDAADVSSVRQQTLQTVTLSNFRNDLNASGRIDAADVSVTRQQTLTSLP
jgi:hypothetical protein